MKYGRFASALAALVWLCIAPAHACGRERWPAKVLADGSLLASFVTVADVASLRELPRPNGVDGFDAPRVNSERKIYRVQGQLLGFKVEEDGDIHAVIAQAGERSQTLIAEIPEPRCMAGAPNIYVNDVARARLGFVKRYGIPPFRTFGLAYQPIVITGPIFFDFGHDQDGAAPNQAEIHPVLSVGDTAVTYPSSSPSFRNEVRRHEPSLGCAGDVRVWVNTKSRAYHMPRSRWYGTTRRGEYLCRREADAAGYGAALNE